MSTGRAAAMAAAAAGGLSVGAALTVLVYEWSGSNAQQQQRRLPVRTHHIQAGPAAAAAAPSSSTTTLSPPMMSASLHPSPKQGAVAPSAMSAPPSVGQPTPVVEALAAQWLPAGTTLLLAEDSSSSRKPDEGASWLYHALKHGLPVEAGKPLLVHGEGALSSASLETAASEGWYHGRTLFVREGYVSSFNPRLRIPNWVVETFSAETLQKQKEKGGGAKRDGVSFTSNALIDEAFRATNADYSSGGHGTSRGHLAAAQFHKGSPAEMEATFDLSLNAVPQDMTVNACDWFRLEQLTKQVAKDFERVTVVTGPVFAWRPKLSSSTGASSSSAVRKVVEYDVIGEHNVAVPTHLFKVVLGENPAVPSSSPTTAPSSSLGKKSATATAAAAGARGGGAGATTPGGIASSPSSYALAAFVVPNEPIVEERPMTAYQVPLEQLEAAVGLTFFPILRQRCLAVGRGSSGSTKNNSGTAFYYDMCARHACTGSYGSFSQVFRHVGRLRAARDLGELEERHAAALKAFGEAEKAQIEKEYAVRRACLTTLSAGAAAATPTDHASSLRTMGLAASPQPPQQPKG